MRFSPYWLQIKFSMSLCSFPVYFCDQSVAPEFVTAVFFNNQRVIQWRGQDCEKKHINTLSIHSYARIGIKISALKMQCVCIFFISAEYLQKILFDKVTESLKVENFFETQCISLPLSTSHLNETKVVQT